MTVPFTIDNDPDFAIATMDPWIMVPGGVRGWSPPIFVEPVNGFGADVSLSVVVPEGLGITGELDFAWLCALHGRADADPSRQPHGRRYTVVVSGTSVIPFVPTNHLHRLEILSSLFRRREQELIDGDLSIAAPSCLALTSPLEAWWTSSSNPTTKPCLRARSYVGAIDANGDLTFDVAFTVDDHSPPQLHVRSTW